MATIENFASYFRASCYLSHVYSSVEFHMIYYTQYTLHDYFIVTGATVFPLSWAWYNHKTQLPTDSCRNSSKLAIMASTPLCSYALDSCFCWSHIEILHINTLLQKKFLCESFCQWPLLLTWFNSRQGTTRTKGELTIELLDTVNQMCLNMLSARYRPFVRPVINYLTFWNKVTGCDIFI